MEAREAIEELVSRKPKNLPEELAAWREAHEHLREALKATLLLKAVPLEKRDAFLFQLELLSNDAEDLGDLLGQRIDAQRVKDAEESE